MRKVPESGRKARDVGVRFHQRTVVLDQAFEHFPREVKSVELRISRFKLRHDTKGLSVVVKAFIVAHAGVELVLSGVSERGMAQIVRERERFGEILVETEGACDGARDLRNLQRMRQPRPVMVTLVGDKDLCLLLQTAECAGVNDPVAISLERRPGG